MIEVIIQDETEEPESWKAEVEAFARKVIQALGIQDFRLGILICDSGTITRYNREFRGLDQPTDVLSFVEDPQDLTGDLVICPAYVGDNARYFEVDYHNELSRIIIHGILHLLGRDHRTNDAHEPMILEQEALLDDLWKRGEGLK